MSIPNSVGIKESPALSRGFLADGVVESRGLYLIPVDGGVGTGDIPSMCRLLARTPDGTTETTASTQEIRAWAKKRGTAVAERIGRLLDHISGRRPDFAGLSADRPAIMGIINVTPDSFSDGGDFLDPESAIVHGRRLAAEGASILDVGGESTRPGAAPISPDEELARVLPVVRGLASEGFTVSIDTRRSGVMAAALEAGAAIVNDVTALSGDSDSLRVVAGSSAPVVLMHIQGDPGTMQDSPAYVDAALDVFDYLKSRIETCQAAGISRDRIAVDPGIGFGKDDSHNLRILSSLGVYHGLGCPVLLGASRKSFIGRLSADEPVSERLGGSIAAALAGISQGVQMLRVHDVAATRQAFAIWRSIRSASRQDSDR